jgi:integrase
VRVRALTGIGAQRESYTVVGEDGRVVEPVDDFLAMCTDREYSPNTIRARAYDLVLWLRFLALLRIDLLAATPEQVDHFAGWLRRPLQPGALALAATVVPAREASTVNRALDSVYALYDFLARRGVGLAAQLVTFRAMRRGDDRGFLAGIATGPVKVRPTKLKTSKARPATLTDEEVQRVLDACTRLRDRFLLALMFETGCRIGQALGLRHEDVDTDRYAITLVPRRDNANRARGKHREPKQIPVRRALCDLYVNYLFAEYGELDSDYVFVNLWESPVGCAMTYWGAMSLVKRLRRRSGVDFHPHLFRHTHATALLRAGVRLEVVSELLTHASARTTDEIYVHMDTDDMADELVRSGFWAGEEGR